MMQSPLWRRRGLVALIAWGAACGGVASAQVPAAGRAVAASPDSLGLPAPQMVDPSERVEQLGDTLAVGSGFSAPSWVMMRSFLVPGWGQAKNGSWWKALFCAGVGAAFYERLYFEDRMVDEYRAKMAAADDEYLAAVLAGKVERHRNHRRDFIWWTGLFLALCGGDAYVDAHLRGFEVKIQVAPDFQPPIHEPAGESAASGWGTWGLRAGLSLSR